MKVVLFCGGMGMRLREYSDLPKPLVTVGDRPILWHLMHYYAHYNHNEFILCLGYKAEVIEEYFLNCGSRVVEDYSLQTDARHIRLVHPDKSEWSITFVYTGLHANIGQRLKQVEQYLHHEETFMANYADGLTDLHLPTMIRFFQSQNKVALFMSVHPPQTFHVVSFNLNGLVHSICDVHQSNLWVNGGYFIFKKSVFNYIRPSEELIIEPFQRLIGEENLITYQYEGFWACMDTFKEKQQLDELCSKKVGPWEAWRIHAEWPSQEHINSPLHVMS